MKSIRKSVIKLIWVLVIFSLAFCSTGVISVRAQDPIDWQNSATGLSVKS